MARFRGSTPADGAQPEHAEEREERPRRRFGEDLMRRIDVRSQKES